jgi:hypothetical protein
MEKYRRRSIMTDYFIVYEYNKHYYAEICWTEKDFEKSLATLNASSFSIHFTSPYNYPRTAKKVVDYISEANDSKKLELSKLEEIVKGDHL